MLLLSLNARLRQFHCEQQQAVRDQRMLAAVLSYIAEIAAALASVHEEARLLAHIRIPARRRKDHRSTEEESAAT